MKLQVIIYVIIALFGLGAGLGTGVLITKPKIEKSNATIADLQTKMRRIEAISQKQAKNSRSEIIRLNNELKQVKTELKQVQATNKQTVMEMKPSESALDMQQTATTEYKEYTVKEGDSFWKIASNQLGDGERYKEIMALNPDVSANRNLAIGSKLKVPAQ